jgi:hypothetical protein
VLSNGTAAYLVLKTDRMEKFIELDTTEGFVAVSKASISLVQAQGDYTMVFLEVPQGFGWPRRYLVEGGYDEVKVLVEGVKLNQN